MGADKKLKKAALDNALQTLADPTKAAKVDPVSQVFAQYWKQKAADMEKNKDKVLCGLKRWGLTMLLSACALRGMCFASAAHFRV